MCLELLEGLKRVNVRVGITQAHNKSDGHEVVFVDMVQERTAVGLGVLEQKVHHFGISRILPCLLLAVSLKVECVYVSVTMNFCLCSYNVINFRHYPLASKCTVKNICIVLCHSSVTFLENPLADVIVKSSRRRRKDVLYFTSYLHGKPQEKFQYYVSGLFHKVLS